LLALIAIVLGIQFSGIGFGLPHQFHPDEYCVVIESFNTLKLLDGQPFRASSYVLGIRWIYCFSYVLLFLAGYLLRIFGSYAEFYNLFYEYGNPWVNAASPWFYIPPRVVSFGFYVGAMAVLYATVRRLLIPEHSGIDNETLSNSRDQQRNRRFWENAALIITFSALLLPAGYLYSHYGTRESALSFFCLLIPYHAFFRFNPASLRSVLVGAALVGAAAGVKENGAIFIILYLWSLGTAFTQKRISIRRLVIFGLTCGVVSIAVFYLLNIHMLLGRSIALPLNKVLSFQEPGGKVFRPGRSYLSNWYVYPKAFLHQFSFPVLAALLAGTALNWLRFKKLRPLILVIVGTWLVLTFARGSGLKSDRYIMNIFLPLYLVGTVGISKLLYSIKRPRLLWLLPLLLIIFNGRELGSIFVNFHGRDTREIAGQWIEKNLPGDRPIAREIIKTPCLDTTRFTVALQKWYLGAQPLDSLRARGIEYLVFSERYTSGWVHGERVAGNYRTFMPYVIKTFETKWQPRLNDFHSPKIYVAKTSGR
ncbi:MAG: hypothetical protein ACOC4C_05430, partial [Fibrobacterota bacterium]